MRFALMLGATLALGLAATAAEESTKPQAKPVPPVEVAGRLALPEGFTATLFAGEPDVVQPIAFTIDPRGRLWVAECYTYPEWSRDGKGHDRILIFEDEDGDGRFDHRKVFWDQGANVSGLEVGFGGVWVCATPNFLFIPDKNGDDVPDGKPVVKLDGWSLDAQHNVFNGLTWGPDGWLYGCNGILSNSRVGKPGTPDADRVALNCGVWRYHPTREVFEAVAHGTTNPWGLDFDDYGEMFITNCVIPHLFHVVAGAHYQRMFGEDINPKTYELLKTCADHVHWDTREKWSDIRQKGVTPTTNQAGGGHAHVGAMVYLGDNWPASYRGSVFTCNIHGHRINHDNLKRSGSSYVASHEKDFLLANDDWFRGLELQYGPDGAVYITDWSDTGECHEADADGAHRENGRILKVAYGQPKPVKVDLAKLSNLELVNLQLHKNDWYVRTARRLLQERRLSGDDQEAVKKALWSILKTNPDETRQLRALWALNVVGGLSESELVKLLDNKNEHVRTWSVRLLGDEGAPGAEALQRLAGLAKAEPSARVRLALASFIQRLPIEQRWSIAEALATRGEDADDAMLPLMVWYGIEPLVPADAGRALDLTTRAEIPTVRRLVARRVVDAEVRSGLNAVVAALAKSDDPARQRDWLDGALEALRGQRSVDRPEGWAEAARKLHASTDADVRERADLLALRFGDAEAIASLKGTMMDPMADPERRRRALTALVERRVPGMASALQTLVKRDDLLDAAIPSLAAIDDAATPGLLLERYAKLPESAQIDALATLSARPESAKALLDAIGTGRVPRRDLSVTLARQILAFGDEGLTSRLEEVWGTTRPTSQEKASLLEKYKGLLTSDALAKAEPAHGRAVFERTCYQCHKMYGEGGDVGPELTGSDRANLDYVLENVLDPSASVGNDYKMMVVATTDGRLLTGIIREQNESALVLQTANERVVVPRDEIEAMRASNESMMPEGLFDKLTSEEVRDLVAYLASKKPLPAKEEPE